MAGRLQAVWRSPSIIIGLYSITCTVFLLLVLSFSCFTLTSASLSHVSSIKLEILQNMDFIRRLPSRAWTISFQKLLTAK
jgi:hypothetical protein